MAIKIINTESPPKTMGKNKLPIAIHDHKTKLISPPPITIEIAHDFSLSTINVVIVVLLNPKFSSITNVA